MGCEQPYNLNQGEFGQMSKARRPGYGLAIFLAAKTRHGLVCY